MPHITLPCSAADCGTRTEWACSRCGAAICLRHSLAQQSARGALRYVCPLCWAGGPTAPKPKPPRARRAPTVWCVLFSCEQCGEIVYRRDHIKRKTEQLVAEVKMQGRASLWKHRQATRCKPNRLMGELWVNERYSYSELGIVGSSGIEAPASIKPTRVLPILTGGAAARLPTAEEQATRILREALSSDPHEQYEHVETLDEQDDEQQDND